MKKFMFSFIMFMMVMFVTSCSGAMADEPEMVGVCTEKVAHVSVTFDCEIPADFISHINLDVVRNNDAANDVEFFPVTTEKFSVTYNDVKPGALAILVFQAYKTNWPLTTVKPGEIRVRISEEYTYVTGKTETVITESVVPYDAGNIAKILTEVRTRTYSLRFDKNLNKTSVQLPEAFL